MNLFNALNGKGKSSTNDLIGAASIEDNCLITKKGVKAGFLIISPVNLNVLSQSVIQSKVDNLAKSIKEIGSCEILAINSAQSYEHNKRFLSQQLLREGSDEVKKIDRQDISFLDEVQVSMATSREFLLKLCFLSENFQQVAAALEKMRQIMTQNDFVVRSANRHDLKRMMEIYLEQNIYEEEMQDFDGERYAPILEMKK